MTERTWVDGHLDLAYVAVNGADLTAPVSDPADRCVSLPALRDARVDVVFGTIFTDPEDADAPEGYAGSTDREGAHRAGLRQLDVYRDLDHAGAVRLVTESRHLTTPGPTPAVVLLMEGADPIECPDDVPAWFDAGLRIVGLTWAMGSRYAGGNETGGGLTPEGRVMITDLDAVGMIHDVSHLSEAAFDDLMAHATGPVIASHSNCRAQHDAGERSLTDRQIRELAERDAVIGLNLFSRFLTNGRATIDDAVRHVEHVVEIMGHRRGVGLGSDMDGGFPPHDLPVGLDHPAHLGALADALAARGWSEADLDGFAAGNWRHVLLSAWA